MLREGGGESGRATVSSKSTPSCAHPWGVARAIGQSPFPLARAGGRTLGGNRTSVSLAPASPSVQGKTVGRRRRFNAVEWRNPARMGRGCRGELSTLPIHEGRHTHK